MKELLSNGQIFWALAVSLLNIGIHATAMERMRRMILWSQPVASRVKGGVRQVVTMMAAVSVLMMAHIVEAGVWAATFRIAGAVQPLDAAYYLAFVSYTTLGYGDVVPAAEWRLLGPMAAMNGILLFGWSTAVLVHTLRLATASDPGVDTGA